MSSPTKHGVKGRVYLTPEEASAAARQFGCARFVYNHLLEFSRSRYFTNKTKTSPAERLVADPGVPRFQTGRPCWGAARMGNLQEVHRLSLQN